MTISVLTACGYDELCILDDFLKRLHVIPSVGLGVLRVNRHLMTDLVS